MSWCCSFEQICRPQRDKWQFHLFFFFFPCLVATQILAQNWQIISFLAIVSMNAQAISRGQMYLTKFLMCINDAIKAATMIFFSSYKCTVWFIHVLNSTSGRVGGSFVAVYKHNIRTGPLLSGSAVHIDPLSLTLLFECYSSTTTKTGTGRHQARTNGGHTVTHCCWRPGRLFARRSSTSHLYNTIQYNSLYLSPMGTCISFSSLVSLYLPFLPACWCAVDMFLSSPQHHTPSFTCTPSLAESTPPPRPETPKHQNTGRGGGGALQSQSPPHTSRSQ